MAPALVLMLAAASGAGYLAFVRFCTESREVRFWAVWALVGCVVLCLAAIFNSLCGIAENRSELFYERCHGSVPYIPLYAIPPLLVLPFLRHFLAGPVVLMVGALLVVVAIAVPNQMFNV